MKQVQLPDSCCDIIRSLCSTKAEMHRVFGIDNNIAGAILSFQPVMVTPQRADLIQSICMNELKYAIPARVNAIMKDPKRAGLFALWVNTAARMMDSFRNVQEAGIHESFMTGCDALLSSLVHMTASMYEVEPLLEHLHRYCPQFDQLFFHGTRFLERQSESAEMLPDRVLSSVDVLALSPEDAETYSQL